MLLRVRAGPAVVISVNVQAVLTTAGPHQAGGLTLHVEVAHLLGRRTVGSVDGVLASPRQVARGDVEVTECLE